MVFTLASQMYHRKSVLVPVLVRVPEYLSPSTSTSTSTMTLELTSTVRVPEIQYSSTVSTGTEYEYPSPDKNPCFFMLLLEFGVNVDIHKHDNSEVPC